MKSFTEVYRQLVVQLNCHMKRIRIVVMGVLLWASINAHAAQTARATLFCLSVRFQRGVYHGLAGDITLDLSTINLDNLGDPASPKNGELKPTDSDPIPLYDWDRSGSRDMVTPCWVEGRRLCIRVWERANVAWHVSRDV